jgi:hypothetical protein
MTRILVPNRSWFLSWALAVALVPAAAYADKTYAKGKGETWDCAKDPVVRISTTKGTFGLLGECKSVTVGGAKNAVSVASAAKLVVAGSDNVVQVEEVDSIRAGGTRNTVSWKKAKTGDKPKIVKSGSGTHVDQAK